MASREGFDGADGAVVADGEVVAMQPVLLLDAVLNDGKHGLAGANGSEGCCCLHAAGRDLLDFEGDDVAASGEVGGFAGVVPAGFDAAIDDESARGQAGSGSRTRMR